MPKQEYSAELFEDLGEEDCDLGEEDCRPITFGPWVPTYAKAVQWAGKRTDWHWANINMRQVEDHSIGDVVDTIVPE